MSLRFWARVSGRRPYAKAGKSLEVEEAKQYLEFLRFLEKIQVEASGKRTDGTEC